MICILHGYLLEGSGSNLWTRSIIQSLCKNGETVHLVCQENHPELYDFISEVFIYDSERNRKQVFLRETPYNGHCIMHKPWIGDTLPVYVWDKYEEFTDVQPMIQLNTQTIESYLDRNVSIIKEIAINNKITVLHANHAVLMSVAAQRVAAQLSIPYTIMPHGSAIEYAVKKDERFYQYAFQAFEKSKSIFVIGKEIRQRINTLFSAIPNLDKKMHDLNLGADTSLFVPVERSQRHKNIVQLEEAIKKIQRGKTQSMSDKLISGLKPNIQKHELIELIDQTNKYTAKNTDENLENALKSINWGNDKLIFFVGRIISSKGLHSIFAAMPYIFHKYQNAKLIITGHGPLRETLEVFLWALENNAKELVFNLIQWGKELEGTGQDELTEISSFYQHLEQENKLQDYFNMAAKSVRRKKVVFTGYLTHNELQFLFPAIDVAIFPSVVAEAGPLVFLEAMASGCFPIGTYFAGMAASIDSIQGSIPDDILDIMKLNPDPAKTVQDMVQKIDSTLELNGKYSTALRNVAVERYDWQNISKRFSAILKTLSPSKNKI